MARFDVYRHPDATQRARTPYLIDVQNDYIAGLHTASWFRCAATTHCRNRCATSTLASRSRAARP